MLDHVKHFAIHPKLPESDHLPLMLCIDLKQSSLNINTDNRADWTHMYKYIWNKNDLLNIHEALERRMNSGHHARFKESMASLENVDSVAEHFSSFINSTIESVCELKRAKLFKHKGPAWFDHECKMKRREAINAGERITNETDNDRLMCKVREYRATKQLKERNYKFNCAEKIITQYKVNKSGMWKLISSFDRKNTQINIPSREDFVNHFSELSKPANCEYFDYSYEQLAVEFLSRYDNDPRSYNMKKTPEMEIMNQNFTESEIIEVIKNLKNNESAGIDSIPAEFLKYTNSIIATEIADLFNYAIELRSFPDKWAEGIRTPIFKSGSKMNANNYRGITVLPIFEKIFEIAVQKRFEFINEAFEKI